MKLGFPAVRVTIWGPRLRSRILYLTGFRQRAFYGRDYTLKGDIAVSDLDRAFALAAGCLPS